MLDPLLQTINAWAPALVISETGVLAAPLACGLSGCPQLTPGFGMPPPPTLLPDAADAFAPYWQVKTGGPPPADLGLYKHPYLDIYPRSLQPADLQCTPRCQALRPCTPLRVEQVALPSALSARCAGLETWPLVYLTLGTVVNHSQALRLAAQALVELPLRLVVTVGNDGDPATSKRNSTAVATLFTFCPPGPDARTKRSISSSSGISICATCNMPRF